MITTHSQPPLLLHFTPAWVAGSEYSGDWVWLEVFWPPLRHNFGQWPVVSPPKTDVSLGSTLSFAASVRMKSVMTCPLSPHRHLTSLLTISQDWRLGFPAAGEKILGVGASVHLHHQHSRPSERLTEQLRCVKRKMPFFLAVSQTFHLRTMPIADHISQLQAPTTDQPGLWRQEIRGQSLDRARAKDRLHTQL
jgi:hypothetical protein